MEGANWEFETRCKRCLKLNKWHHSGKKEIPFEQFAKDMYYRATTPIQSFCPHCEKPAIQELISYTDITILSDDKG